MSEETENCDVGVYTESECHLTCYTAGKCLHKFESLSAEDISLLKYRIVNFHEISKGTICDHHKNVYLTHFTSLKRKCCDPFKKHRQNVVDNLRILKQELCEKALNCLFLKIIPGDKICHNCEITLLKNIKCITESSNTLDQTDLVDSRSEVGLRHSERVSKIEKISLSNYNVKPESQSSSTTAESTASNFSEFSTLSQDKRVINTILNSLELPNLNDLQFYKTRRVHDAENIVHDVCKNFTQVMAKATEVDIVVPEPVSRNIIEDSSILRELLSNLQKKFESTETVYGKLEILALLPKNWNRNKIRQYFACTDYMSTKLNQFKEMDGMSLIIIYKTISIYF